MFLRRVVVSVTCGGSGRVGPVARPVTRHGLPLVGIPNGQHPPMDETRFDNRLRKHPIPEAHEPSPKVWPFEGFWEGYGPEVGSLWEAADWFRSIPMSWIKVTIHSSRFDWNVGVEIATWRLACLSFLGWGGGGTLFFIEFI